MKIIHRMTVSHPLEAAQSLRALGATIIRSAEILIFEASESSPSWPQIRDWAAKYRAFDILWTEFEEAELEAADTLQLCPTWIHGYPQPRQDSFGFRNATYDASDYCSQCGVGLRQKAPFQMKSEPRWGKNGIMQLNWIGDEFFVQPDVWARVFKPHGIASIPVTTAKGAVLNSVVQIDVKEEVGVDVSGARKTECKNCGRSKFDTDLRGPFHRLRNPRTKAMARTREWFGPGAAAFKCVLISGELYRDLRAIRGAGYRPVALSLDERG